MNALLTVLPDLPDMHVAAGHIGDLASALPAAGKGRWMENRDLTEKLWPATLETFAMTGVSGILTIALGLPLGLALITTGPRGQHRNRVVYEIVSQIVNIGRSMPFIILMVAIMSLTRFLVGSSIGWQAACVPLTIGAIPFYARLVETAINDVDQGKVEAALMMGASGAQITWGVLVREALPTLIQSATVTIITLIGYSAMAGTVGGGGLGDMAIQYGYKGNESDVMIVTVVLIVIVVGIIQVCGDMLSRLVDHR
jgi:metal ion ABC superfamily ATP binding cassette transporter, membrane protein